MSEAKPNLEGGTKKTESSPSEMPPKDLIPDTPPDTTTIDDLRQLAQSPKASTYDEVLSENPEKIDAKTERTMALRIKNEGDRQDQVLKRKTLNRLFRLLYGETIVIFVLAFFQGFKYRGFNLDAVTLRIVVAATLTQIAAMLSIAVRHLFPARKA